MNKSLRYGYIGSITVFILIIFSGIALADVSRDEIVTLYSTEPGVYAHMNVIELFSGSSSEVQPGDVLTVSVEVLNSGPSVDVILQKWEYQSTGEYSGEAKWRDMESHDNIQKTTFSTEISDMEPYHLYRLYIGSAEDATVHITITASKSTSQPKTDEPTEIGDGGNEDGSGNTITGFEAFLVVFVITLIVVWKRE